ncbi:MAG: HAMP domain-containing histidine kinase [Chloroflexi bacterium]|nr:HAMP domain-containing histidine kinase [Chloroflexota bacterium]
MVQPPVNDRTPEQSASRRSWVHSAAHSGLAVGMQVHVQVSVCFLAAVLLDYLAPRPYVMTPLYAIPVLVAAHALPGRTVMRIGALATLVNVVSGLWQGIPPEIVVLYSVGLVLTVYLAVRLALERQRSAHHAEQAEAARRQLLEFMSLVVHELRNPLSAMRGYVQLFRRRSAEDPRSIAHGAQVIEQATGRLARLIDDLLDTTQIESGRFQLLPTPMDLAATARDVVELQQSTTAEHRLVLECPDRVDGEWDRERISQLLANLLTNAVKYSPSGEVRIVIATTADEVTLSVVDQGPGIASAQLDRLFQPFTRLENSPRARGLGVGLSLARGIVEAHGGRIAVDSQPGVGTTFHVTLPRWPVDRRGSAAAIARHAT